MRCNNMKLTFNGGVREVGGSCTVVETEDARVALDYGIKVDEGLSHEMPKDLDVVVVTHAHLDHSGNLLTLADEGPVIVGSTATHDITIELLRDLIKIHRLKGKNLSYGFSDVSKISDLWLTRERVAIPGMEISLHPAGHVLGANMVQLKTKGKTLLYTGDFCIHDTEILNGADPEKLPKEPDVLIMESTYGGTIRPKRPELVKALFGKIIETIEREGNVLVPAFAFHRLQEMVRRVDLAMREKTLPRYNAYYISGLGHRLNHYYNNYKSLLSRSVNEQAKPFSFARVKRLKRTGRIKEPAIVICTSGFGHAGASHSLLLDWAGNEDDTIIINSGYLPPDSPLLSAKEGKIVNNGESIQVEADVEQIELSGHADQEELTEFVKTLKPKETFLVHGNLDQAQALSDKINEYTDVQIPRKNESFVF
jgi:Cft2 family RNA processing exonuclease